MARLVSFLVLIGILVIISIVFVRVMAGFLVPLFLAALIVVVIQPLHRWILARCRDYRYVAATVTTSLVVLIVLLPIGLVVTTAILEGLSLFDQLQLVDVRTRLDNLRGEFNLVIPQKENLYRIEASLRRWRSQQLVGDSPDIRPGAVENLLDRVREIEAWLIAQGDAAPPADIAKVKEALETLHKAPPGSLKSDDALARADAEFRDFKRKLLGGTYRAWLAEAANPTDAQLEQLRRQVLSAAGPVLSFGGDTAKLVGRVLFGLIIMIAALFFMLAEGPKMLEALIRISPLEEQYVRALVVEFDRACRAIVSATLLSAIVQGLLAGIGFYVVGLRGSVALLSLLTMVLALVPFMGAAAVWIPTSLYLYFYEGNLWAAIGLALYGALVVSTSDNFIKPWVLHGQSNLHPLLALLSVLGGLQALGPIGILVGPMVVVFLQTLLKLVQREMSSMDRSAWSFWRSLGNFAGRANAARPPPLADADATDDSSAPDAAAAGAASSPVASASDNGRTSAKQTTKSQAAQTGKKRQK